MSRCEMDRCSTLEVNMTETDGLVLDVPEAGRLLNLSRATAYALARSGQLPTVRFGRRILVPKAALERLLAEGRDRLPPETPLSH